MMCVPKWQVCWASPGGLGGVVGADVLPQHHLGLVLEVLHLLRVLQTPSLCVHRTGEGEVI